MNPANSQRDGHIARPLVPTEFSRSAFEPRTAPDGRQAPPPRAHDPHVRPAPETFGGRLRHLGPGLIISAAIVGSGELILTTKLGAEVGFTLLWFIILGCLLKVFVQLELGRYTVLEGRTTLQMLNSMPGPRGFVSWLVWIWLLMFVATFFQVAGMVGGIASAFRLGGMGTGWSDPIWIGLICLVTALLLGMGQYRTIERVSTVMVALFTLFTIAAVMALHWTPYALRMEDLATGFSLRLPADFTVAFAAFGIIGVGASELIYYPYWCLEKGYARHVGPNDGTSEWVARARGWVRVMHLDAWVSMVIYTMATIAFYLLGAAVLNAKGVAVADTNLMASLSEMYRESFGAVGFWCYLLGAIVVLYSTVYIATASNGRLTADLLRLFGAIRWQGDSDRARVVKATCLLLPLVYFGLYLGFGAPVSLVLVGALAQALMLPLLAGVAVYLLHRRTAAVFRPGVLWYACLWTAASLMVVLGVYQAVDQVRKWLG